MFSETKDMMTQADDVVWQQIYNLILNPRTREWERQVLVKTKDNVNGFSLNTQLDQLKSELKPLAVRRNLTPDVMDFYLSITGEKQIDTRDKMSRHYQADLPYQERAIFAGGCFWCMVEPFDKLPGIIDVISGYTGGSIAHPSYDEVFSQITGHIESVEIIFDSRQITYQQLLAIYWSLIDPTDEYGQFDDRGESYKPVIFVTNNVQLSLAKKSKTDMINSQLFKKPIVVDIREVLKFWPAENYHQDFYKKNVSRYRAIKRSRKIFLKLLQTKKAMHRIFTIRG